MNFYFILIMGLYLTFIFCAVVHLYGIKDKIVRNATDHDKALLIFRKTCISYSPKKLRKELYEVTDHALVDLFFRWLYFYQTIMGIIMVFLWTFGIMQQCT